MPALRDFKRRIRSIESTQKITQAMKAVATAQMARAQNVVTGARPYAHRLQEVLGRVGSASRDVDNPLLTVREPEKVCFVVITSDRGLCGGFNSNLLRLANREIEQWENARLVVVGRKARNYFNFRNWEADEAYIGLGDHIEFEKGREIAQFLIDKYVNEDYDAVYLIYSKFVSVLKQDPTITKLLPVEPPAGGENEEETEEKQQEQQAGADYVFEPSPEAVLDYLLPKYVANTVYHALIESKASEQSARMMAMDGATKNAGEMIEKLSLQMNRQRQENITKELLDIVGGAAALE